MSRIAQAFADKKAFIGFITGGDGGIQASVDNILAMERAGASLVEIGIPFSDPVAEGPIIQQANIRALDKDIKTEDMFTIVEQVRKVSQIALVFLTYANPVYAYGYDRFFARCKQVGVDGIIIPDIPFEESEEIASYCERYGVDQILLVSPTSKQRIQAVAKKSRGFVYLVSSLGVTGTRDNITTDLDTIIKQIKQVTSVPVAIGFGIHAKQQVHDYAKIADGVIVGSAIVKLCEQHPVGANQAIYEYVNDLVSAI
ncbi:tryptophan synthase subunit alpha [Erysipelotrichaceae bacterium MTC7]|nr:tryptophan synthase subunit alpha [Erysipelotrichaceae bacterium MTC7]